MKRLAALLTCTALFSALALLGSCKKEEPEWKRHSFAKVDFSRSDPQAILPRGLWTRIVDLLKADETAVAIAAERDRENPDAKEGGHASVVAPKQGPLPSVFLPLRVFLVERNRGILVNGDSQIQFSGGGGEIDLADVVNPKNGSFYIAVEFMPDVEDVKRHVYFVSGANERKDGGETLGAGCSSYFEITGAFDKAMAGKGFLVNASDGRHTSALAGTFFFAAAHEGKLYLAALKIKDSAHKQLLCQR